MKIYHHQSITYYGFDTYVIGFLLIINSLFMKPSSDPNFENIIIDSINVEKCYQIKGLCTESKDFYEAIDQIKDGVMYHLDEMNQEVYIEEKLSNGQIHIAKIRYNKNVTFELSLLTCPEYLKSNIKEFNRIFDQNKNSKNLIKTKR